MKSLTISIGIALLLAGFALNCNDQITPPGAPPPSVNEPPTILEFFTSSTTLRMNEVVQITYRIRDDSGIVSMIVNYSPDSTIDSTYQPAQPYVQGSLRHRFTESGTTFPRMIVRDSRGLSDTATIRLDVLENLPPVILLNAIACDEGSSATLPVSSVAVDPEGNLASLSAVSISMDIDAIVEQDTLRISPSHGDINGSRGLQLVAIDDRGLRTERTIFVDIAPRDDIYGRVHDALEGTTAATLNPSLVLQGPFTSGSYVTIDGLPVPLNADGTYRADNLEEKGHLLAAFLTNGIDSSFVLSVELRSGDQTFHPVVHTNAGTGMDLRLLWDFYDEANMSLSGRLGGIDFDHAESFVYYFPGKDSLDREGMIPEEQSTLESWLLDEIFTYLPPAQRPRIVKGNSADVLPGGLKSRLGGDTAWIPANGYCIVWKKSSQASAGAITLFNEDPVDDIYESAQISLRYDRTWQPATGLDKSAFLRECMIWLCGPAGEVHNPRLADRTCMQSTERPDSPAVTRNCSGSKSGMPAGLNDRTS
jgi:hypothetical protein